MSRSFYSRESILTLHEKGLSPKEIQARIGCCRTTVLRALKGRLPGRGRSNKKSPTFDMWVVYEKPADFPDEWVARKWVDHQPTDELMRGNSIHQMRDIFRDKGLARLKRHIFDDPVILEVWL